MLFVHPQKCDPSTLEHDSFDIIGSILIDCMAKPATSSDLTLAHRHGVTNKTLHYCRVRMGDM